MTLLGSVTSSKIAAKVATILDFTKYSNLSKNSKIETFFARVVKYDTIKYFATFSSVLYGFLPKKGEKHAFLFKNGLTLCYLLPYISLL